MSGIALTLSYDAKPQNRFTYSAEVIALGVLCQWKTQCLFGRVWLSLSALFRIEFLVNYNQIELPAPWNTNSFWLLGLKSNLTLTNKIFFSNLFQYNEQLGLWNFNSRFQWRYQTCFRYFLSI